ncbi:hypothetical protein ACFHW2_11960 [Actinomadura sp. LOL_016]|uniref:hypothetical protein n=1 Tax=unclassified Actinomadura TaxID=2626254 RepID=UPI003A800125
MAENDKITISWESTSVFSHTFTRAELAEHADEDGDLDIDSVLADLEGPDCDAFEYVAERDITEQDPPFHPDPDPDPAPTPEGSTPCPHCS